MNHCAPPRGPQHIETRKCINLMTPFRALYCRQEILTKNWRNLARSYILNSEKSFKLDTDRTVQNRVLEIKKLMLRGHKIKLWLLHISLSLLPRRWLQDGWISYQVKNTSTWSSVHPPWPSPRSDLCDLYRTRRLETWNPSSIVETHHRIWFLAFVTSNVT